MPSKVRPELTDSRDRLRSGPHCICHARGCCPGPTWTREPAASQGPRLLPHTRGALTPRSQCQARGQAPVAPRLTLGNSPPGLRPPPQALAAPRCPQCPKTRGRRAQGVCCGQGNCGRALPPVLEASISCHRFPGLCDQARTWNFPGATGRGAAGFPASGLVLPALGHASSTSDPWASQRHSLDSPKSTAQLFLTATTRAWREAEGMNPDG